MIHNPQHTTVKVILVLYDYSDMPPKTKTFLRQRTVSEAAPRRLLSATHLKFVRMRNHLYLHSPVRVVFSHCMADREEAVRAVQEGPTSPRYVPLSEADRALLRQQRDRAHSGGL